MTTLKYLPNFVKNRFEKASWSTNQLVCGIDEVGRGCLAGPLVVAAVILPVNRSYKLLKDSKILSAKELQLASSWIIKNCHFSIVPVHHRLIDSRNVYQATLFAMARAVMQVCTLSAQKPAQIVVDAMPLKLTATPYHDIPIAHFIKGESKSSSIAAASIIAKVYRDNLITEYDKLIPGYYLEEHKGYGTEQHRNALNTLGKSFIHRTTFIKKVTCGNSYDTQHQQTIC
ncbi:MAG: ribonuclease HII [Candidatus Babeliales bacterium]